jgi:UDP-N-acetylglucosamine:LPS N-acetylglucosamine transferase
LPAAAWKIAGLLNDKPRLEKMHEAARGLGRPTAAATIAEDALRLLD